jgi:translation initiation factor IF-3
VSLNKKAHKGPRLNDQIKVSHVSVIEEDGQSAGVMTIGDALLHARQKEMDLVEVAPMATPPVCRLMNYQREQYRQKKKLSQQKKLQKRTVLKEVQLRPVIQEHDYGVKLNSIKRFLQDGDQVKIMINFRGREITLQKDKGFDLLKKILSDVDGLGRSDTMPKLEGRRIVLMLQPIAQSSTGGLKKNSVNEPKEAKQSAGDKTVQEKDCL